MEFDWISFLIVFAIGLGGGIISGIFTTFIGRFRLKRKINKELKRMKLLHKGYKCISCDRFNPKQTLFCVFCGVPTPSERVCVKCGTDLPKDADYCYLCLGGAVLKDTIIREPGIKITEAETIKTEPIEAKPVEIEEEKIEPVDTEEIESFEYETDEADVTPVELSEYKEDEFESSELEETPEEDSQEKEEW